MLNKTLLKQIVGKAVIPTTSRKKISSSLAYKKLIVKVKSK